MADEDSGAQCLICLHPLLEQPACALRCGHVYHGQCFQIWLLKSRGECPQCKQVSRVGEVRMLEFEMGDVIHDSLEEVLRIEALTDEQRTALDTKLAVDCAKVEIELRKVEEELAEWRSSAQELKRQRLDDVMPETRDAEERLAQVLEERGQRMVECAKLRTELDAVNTCQQKRLPIPQLQDGDQDLAEERRKLRVLRPADRAKQLHEALVHARHLEQNVRRQLAGCVAAADGVEQKLRKKRQQDSILRRQRSEHHEEVLERQQSQTSAASSSSSSSSSAAGAGAIAAAAAAASPPPAGGLAGDGGGSRPGSQASEPGGAGGAGAPPAGASGASGGGGHAMMGAGRARLGMQGASAAAAAAPGRAAAMLALPSPGAGSSSGLPRGASWRAAAGGGGGGAAGGGAAGGEGPAEDDLYLGVSKKPRAGPMQLFGGRRA